FLAAYFFCAPLWQRAVVLLSTIPIAIVMNSFRIGMVGVSVDRWGSEQADGLLHFFEGWVIFLACAGLLALEMMLFARIFARKRFFELFQLPEVVPSRGASGAPFGAQRLPLLSCLFLLCATAGAIYYLSGRLELVPE